MNTIRIFIIIAVILLIPLTSGFAQKKATIHGEIVELMSYIKDGMKPNSPSKKEVVLENMKKGGPLAIIDKTNSRMYIIAPAANDTSFVKNVTPYIGAKSFVKGTTYIRNGVRMIILEDIGKSLK
jgi:hypothetical protein